MTFIVSNFNQQSQKDQFTDLTTLNLNFNGSAMSRNIADDRNNLTSFSDFSAFHNSSLSEWPANKMQSSYMMQTNQHMYHSPSTGYPIYNTTNTATVSTPSYCSTFSEASHSSPTLFWAPPAVANTETENNSLFTEVAPNEMTPEPEKNSASSSEIVFESSQREKTDMKSHTLSRPSHYSHSVYHPQITQMSTRQVPTNSCTTVNSKAHSRFKSANTCLSSYDDRSKHTQQFLSPPLPSTSFKRTSSPPTEATQSLMNSAENSCKSAFQFQAVLHSPTASMKKEDQKPITYLNRGQPYLLELSSMNRERGTLTSTVSIAFHEASHRKVADSYWRFWLSQHVVPHEARAIDIDENQTTGIYNIHYESFDKITFDWQGRFGAKIHIRFYCLSTDFSRIKGVKGIPMRAVVETTAKYSQMPKTTSGSLGTLIKKRDSMGLENGYKYIERCFCQIKLFRDKGAERKNKDDAKQIHKQLQKATAITMGNPQRHASWPILNQTYKPVTVLSETLSSPEIEPIEAIKQEIETLPSEMYSPTVVERPSLSLNDEKVPNKKRKHVYGFDDVKEADFGFHPSYFHEHSHMAKRFQVAHSVLDFYIYSKRQFPPIGPERISLESLTKEDLKIKLSNALSLSPEKVSEILWKKRKTSALGGMNDGKDDLEILVDDPFMAENIFDEETVAVDWEMKQDGYVRLILEFDGYLGK